MEGGIVRSRQTKLGKILLVISEDWFALSHFQPLIRTLLEIAKDVVVATRSSGRFAEIDALGARVRDFDIRRSSLNPMEQSRTVSRLAGLIKEEAPDVLHVVAMQPMVISSLAARLAPRTSIVMHLTGLGFIGISAGPAARVIRPFAVRALSGILKRPDSWLIVENPEDHRFLAVRGVNAENRVTVVPGAGIDPEHFPAQPELPYGGAQAAFVGRMIKSKGIIELAEASRILQSNGKNIGISLFGDSDRDNPEAIRASQLHQWENEGLLKWHGRVSDVAGIWRQADICVLPSTTREGMPRAILEAASSARPLIVTDVPGSRHFVRDGIEGLIVPPGDPGALAEALGALAGNADLRRRMGKAARERIMGGFTVSHVKAGILSSYRGLIENQKV